MRKHTADRSGDRGKHERAKRNVDEGDCRLNSVGCTKRTNSLYVPQRKGSDRDSVGVPDQWRPAGKHHKQLQSGWLMSYKAGFAWLTLDWSFQLLGVPFWLLACMRHPADHRRTHDLSVQQPTLSHRWIQLDPSPLCVGVIKNNVHFSCDSLQSEIQSKAALVHVKHTVAVVLDFTARSKANAKCWHTCECAQKGHLMHSNL